MPETIHLHADAELVPPALLEPPFAGDGKHLMRDLGALLLDRHLRRLTRMRNPLELRLARLLRRTEELSGYVDLGFARLTDYVTERLGFSTRRVQSLLQMERGLRSLPAIGAAFESGRLSQSQVLLLLRVATPDDEVRWLEAATGLTVRRLERKIRESLAERAAGPSGADGTEEGEAPSTTPHDPAGKGDPEDAEPGVEIGFAAPRSLRARWEFAVDLCRKAAGVNEPIRRCAEFFAAEYLAGIPDLPSLLARSLGDSHPEAAGGSESTGGGPAGIREEAGGPDGNPEGAGGGPDASPDAGGGTGDADGRCPAPRPEEDEGVELFEEVLRAYQDGSADFSWAPPDAGFETVIPEPAGEEAGDHPRGLDARLRSLARLRQTLAWHQGRLLRTFAAHTLYRDLGFFSLGRYCTERLGIGLRRARRLIALERRLLELPSLAHAYRTGEVTWVQATEIARVASALDEQDWIRLARSVTVRRLVLEVTLALRRAEDVPGDPAYGGSRRSGPPGLEPSGRVALHSPAWPPHPAADAGLGSGVQTFAPGGDGRAVQTSAPAGSGHAVQTSAPAFEGAAADGFTRIRFWAPHDVAGLWRHALRVCRWVEGAALQDWECVGRLIEHFRATWEVRSDPEWERRYRTHERDGWRCRVPGCSSRRNLQEHHVVFRSRGGGDDPENLVTLCATHHLRALHAGHLRCHRLPEGLLAWELGAGPGGSALVRYVEDVRWEAAMEAGAVPMQTGSAPVESGTAPVRSAPPASG